MESASILTPRTPGRSRFSKALPAPPKFDAGLPSSPRPAAPPPPLPPKAAAAASNARSMDSPLPPVPLKASSPAPAPMSIPRRPVARTNPQPVQQQQQQQQPQPPPPPPGQPSPVGSISSILSAYSHTSGESLMKSSEGTASTKNSYIAVSPGRDGLMMGDLKKDLLLTPLSSSSFSNDFNESLKLLQSQTQQTQQPQTRELPPPPPPAKEETRPQTPVATQQEQQQQQTTDTKSDSPGGINTSPSQPQLWRRRSLKSDRNLTVSELKLTISHGSTAATQPQTQPQPQPTSATSLAPPNPASSGPSPRSPLGLPGRNIRPVPSRELASESPVMGETLSKFEAKIHQFEARIQESKAVEPKSKTDEVAKLSVPPPFQRLPTPEYDRDDVKSSLVPTILSPVSPASSPELPAKEPETRQQQQPIARKAVGLVGREIRPVKSTPSLSPRPTTTTTTPTPAAAAAPPPPPVMAAVSEAPRHQIPAVLRPGGDAAASRDVAPPRSQFPARTTSRLPATQQSQVMLRRQAAEAVSPVEPAPAPAALAPAPTVLATPPQVRMVAPEEEEDEVVVTMAVEKTPSPPLSLDTSESGLSPVGGGGSSGAEPESSATSPSENAIVFPVSFANPAPPGTIFAAPPLGAKNFGCLQQHRQMYKDRNLHCPLSCQTCQRHDTEMRWKCKWCYLRICAPCMEVLHENQRDLQLLLDHLKDPKNAVVVAAPADEHPAEGLAESSSTSIPAAPLPVALEA